MNKFIIQISCFVFLSVNNGNSQAQQFTTGELSTIKPSQVIIENYVPVKLSKEMQEDQNANRFDISNPYTYLQVVTDVFGSRYHILFQTGFTGKLLFLSYSSNLSVLFNKKNKPMFLFNHCLRKVNNYISSIQIIEETIKCILERLNYCYEN